MNNNWIYMIKIYFEMLTRINNNFIKLISLNPKNACVGEYEKLYNNIFDDLSRLLPVHADAKTFKANIEKNDGILNLVGNEIDFLIKDFRLFVNKYNKELFDIKMIRNKNEHIPHTILLTSIKKANGSSSITLNYKNKKSKNVDNFGSIEAYYCNTNILVNIIVDLNTVFSKIQKEIIKYQSQVDNDLDLYFSKILDIDYIWYNDIYKNENCIKICKIISNK